MPSILSTPGLPAVPADVATSPPTLRDFDDTDSAQSAIYDRAISALSDAPTVSNARHTLNLTDLKWADKPDRLTKAERKQAVLTGKSPGRRLQGTWQLVDNATGKEVDRKTTTVAKLPRLTDSGTFIHNGTEYVIRNQQRLRPGIFVRSKANGEIEAFVNVQSGGPTHRYFVDPDKGIFYVKAGQAQIPMLPLLKALGAQPDEIRKAWGDDLYALNTQKSDAGALDKLKSKFLATNYQGSIPEGLKAKFSQMTVDPKVMQRTLGHGYASLDKDAVLAATKKLLEVSRGQAEPDDRDHLANQTIVGPEDMLAERLGKDRAGVRRQLLYKASNRGNLQWLPAAPLQNQVNSLLLESGLGVGVEEINPVEIFDKQFQVSRMGEGGIGSHDAVPDESRSVSPSHYGFIDPSRTPECYDSETDVMTRHGWRSWAEVTINDEFACLIDGRLIWARPSAMFKDEYRGEMLGVSTDTLDYLVTPGHRLWTRPSVTGLKYRIELAADSFGKYRVHSTSHLPYIGDETLSEFAVPDVASFTHNTIQLPKFNIVDWAELLGWYLGEGCSIVRPETGVYWLLISQSWTANLEKCVRISELLTRLDIPHSYNHHMKGFRIGGKQITKYFCQFGYSKNRFIPDEWFDAPLAARQALRDSLLLAEGRRNKKGELYQFISCSKQLADGFQRLLFSLGQPSTISFEPDERQPQYLGCYVVNIHERVERYATRNKYRRVKYNGFVYCATVPGGLLYVRRNGTSGHWSGNSFSAGVDLYFSHNTKKGSDGNVYSKFTDARTGKPVWMKPQDISDKTISFPGTDKLTTKRVPGMRGGKLMYVPRNEIDYTLDSGTQMFSPVGNLVPMKSGIQGQRLAMASRMLTQALPLVHPEAPLVQSAVPGTGGQKSFEDIYGRHAGAVSAKQAGRVVSTDKDNMKVRYDDGTSENIELHNMLPYNRKTYLQQSTLLQPGDKFKAGQPIVKSNFTDHNGTLALGLNAKNAYMSWKGLNHEDAILISESMADRLTSQHMYQHELENTDKLRRGMQSYVSLFPGKFDKELLKTVDDAGLVKPGTTVQFGHPLILGAEERGTGQNKMHRRGQPAFHDVTVTWDHHEPGVVVDSLQGKHGPVVTVKSLHKMQVGDKLSDRQGSKGVVSGILPDAQMPHNQAGEPFEVLLNPLGMISRGNPSKDVETALGKIAAKTGKPFKVEDFDQNIPDRNDWALKLLAQHGLTSTEDVIDPETGRKIPGVMTGPRWFMKLHHEAAGKEEGRAGGTYSADMAPAKGGGGANSKRLAILDLNALLSHGAYHVIKDAVNVRGQRNDDYWLQFMQGHTPTNLKTPLVYDKFIDHLKGAGINVARNGSQLHLMALTDKDVDQLAGDRELQNARTVNWDEDLSPVAGGLFDPGLTGGHHGKKWSRLTLAEPMPSPVMEDPIRHVLGLTKDGFERVLAGDDALNGKKGPQAIVDALKKINVDGEIASARHIIANGRGSKRDAAIRKLGYLKTAKRLNMNLSDWVLHAAPVLPPQFRPVSVLGAKGVPLVSDPNMLYRELFEANSNLANMKKVLPDDGLGPERLAVYHAFKGVTGLGDPITKANQEKGTRGLLKSVFGNTPKFSMMQRKLLSTSMDNVGRAVIVPDPDLDMDSAGIPETKAFDVYSRYIVRRLRRQGMSIPAALRHVKDKTPVARDILLDEMTKRPVIINRSPVLHRYGIMAFRPQLVKGSVVKLPPAVYKGFGADNDGNCVVHDSLIDIFIDKRILSKAKSPHRKAWMSLIKSSRIEIVDRKKKLLQAVIPIGLFPRAGEPKFDKNGAEIYNVPAGVSVLTRDAVTGKSEYATVTAFTVEHNCPCVRMTTVHDRSVEVSGNESLAVFDETTCGLKRVSPKDAIGKLVPFVKESPRAGGGKFSFDLGWWYGSFVSDGWISDRYAGYAKNDSTKREKFIAITRANFDGFSFRTYEATGGGAKYADSVKLHLLGPEFLKQILNIYSDEYVVGRGALRKQLPRELLYSGNRQCLMGLLSGLLDGDGGVAWSRRANGKLQFFARLCTSSRFLLDDIKLLCRLLGIRYNINVRTARGNQVEAYTVWLSTPDVRKIADEFKLVDAVGRAALQKLKEEQATKDDCDIVPVPRAIAVLLSKAVSTKHMTLYGLLRDSCSSGRVTRATARRGIAALKPGQIIGAVALWINTIVENESIHWDIYKTAEEVERQTVYDLCVPSSKVFAADFGLIIYDTMTYQVPADEAAVKEAYEKMLPSRQIFAASDFKTVMPMASQEYVGGLYHASTARSKRPVRTFRSVQDTVAAWKHGDIGVNDTVRILETSKV